MKKYMIRLSRWGVTAEITPVECEKETDKCVWIDGMKRSKKSTYENYYDDYETAKQKLLSLQQRNVEDSEARLVLQKKILRHVELL